MYFEDTAEEQQRKTSRESKLFKDSCRVGWVMWWEGHEVLSLRTTTRFLWRLKGLTLCVVGWKSLTMTL